MENLCSIYRFPVLPSVPCLSRSLKRPGLPRIGLVTNGTRFPKRKFPIENFRFFCKWKTPHVSYGGRRPIYRPTYRPRYRSMLDRYSTDYRSILGRDLVEYQPIAHLMMLILSVNVSTVILSVVYRPTISHISVKCWSSLSRLSINIWGDTSADTRLISSVTYLSCIGQ